MLYENHEVLGTELPILKEKEVEHYTLEDILNTGQQPDNFERCGFVEVRKYNRTLYQPIYKHKG